MLFALFALFVLPVHAANGVLVVMRAAVGVDVTSYELRLRSELQTEGLEAVVVNATAVNQDTKALAGRFGASDVIEVTVTDDDVGAWVWVSEPASSLEVSRSLRVRLPQRDSVTVFALRTVDLLVGAKLELEQQRRAKQAGAAGATNESHAERQRFTAERCGVEGCYHGGPTKEICNGKARSLGGRSARRGVARSFSLERHTRNALASTRRCRRRDDAIHGSPVAAYRAIDCGELLGHRSLRDRGSPRRGRSWRRFS
ncbi:MAG: hypothetical protein QM784_14265 [Polyangiaceae bacterium]